MAIFVLARLNLGAVGDRGFSSGVMAFGGS